MYFFPLSFKEEGPLLTGLLQCFPFRNKHRCQVSINISENNKWVNCMSQQSWLFSISTYSILTLFSCLSIPKIFNYKADPKEFWDSINTFCLQIVWEIRPWWFWYPTAGVHTYMHVHCDYEHTKHTYIHIYTYARITYTCVEEANWIKGKRSILAQNSS